MIPQIKTDSPSETSQVNRGIIVRIKNTNDSFGSPIKIGVVNVASNLIKASSIKVCVKTSFHAPVDGPHSITTTELSRATRSRTAASLRNRIKRVGYKVVDDPEDADLVLTVLYGKSGIGKSLINLVYSVPNNGNGTSKKWGMAYAGIISGKLVAEPVMEQDMPSQLKTKDVIPLYRYSENFDEVDSPSLLPARKIVQNVYLYGLLARAMKHVPQTELDRIVFNLLYIT
ncbi:MAG: hypothetical protein V3T21_06980 [Candidatus Margulisiibacteriota bacterium]